MAERDPPHNRLTPDPSLSGTATRTKNKLKEAPIAHMDMLERHPNRARSYFDDPPVKYAA
jgi:hypothetical protein